MFTWGYGILGKGPNVERSLEPTEIPQILFGKNEFSPDSKVVSITCGLNHQMALTNKGELFAWGLNRGGCLGLGHDNDQYFPFRVSLLHWEESLAFGLLSLKYIALIMQSEWFELYGYSSSPLEISGLCWSRCV